MQLTILGSGNVATALCNAFFEAGHKIIQVYDRKMQSAEKLALVCNAQAIDEIKVLSRESDVYIFCLSDDAISEIAAQINNKDAFCVHTSGAVPLDELRKHFTNCGVLYPVQTISNNRRLNFLDVPICIEASNSPSEEKIKDLSKSISHNIHFVNSQQRSFLHLAAVFANNFTNSLYTNASFLLESQNLSFRLLHSLLLETVTKAIEMDPYKAQTGPAVRMDHSTIDKHFQLLQDYPELKEIYKLMTEQIQHQQKTNDYI